MEDWLNRAGLTLQLIALFFVSPDLLGKERLREVLVTAQRTIRRPYGPIIGLLPLGLLYGYLLNNKMSDWTLDHLCWSG